MAPVLQQSIEVLLLPIMDLEQAIEQELEANPLLEIDESALQNQESDSLDAPFKETVSDEIQRLMDAPTHPYLNNGFEEDEHEDQPITNRENLEQQLLQQLHIDFTDPLTIAIGEMIIGQLNEDGYLTTTCEEIAQSLKIADITVIKSVLKTIQQYEPLGVASRSLEECLLIQAHTNLNGNALLAEKIIKNHLHNLGRKRYDLIAKELKIPLDHVRQCAQLISTLEPRPARNFRPISNANYVKPDIFIREQRTEENKTHYQLLVNEHNIPPLRINPIYKKLAKKKDLTPKEKEFLKEKLQNALAFIKSIQQRGSTIKEIGKFILDKQQGFFEEGHLALQPMGLKDVAEALERNESTISRAISQKYIDTPQGIFPIKYFFSQNVGKDDMGENGIASRSIKEELRSIIAEEDKACPLSDKQLQSILKKNGMNVARRTIGKYRHQLNILPSHLRKI